MPPTPNLTTLPLVGRSRELSLLGDVLDGTEAGRGQAIFLAGEGGVGKTRLARTMLETAARRGWIAAMGRAYPVETGVPYAPFSDALLPVLRQLEPATLSALSRGGRDELIALFPPLAGERGHSISRGDPAELKARLLWNFAQFLARFSVRQPLLIVLENLQWADASSLELLHFVARQLEGERIVLLCTYNEAERVQNPALRTTEQSLLALDVARLVRLEPLSRADVDELVRRVFEVSGTVTREFSALLYGWTRGNPFFVEETIKSLVESGRLFERNGSWLGWELEGFDLPRSIRDAVVSRLGQLTERGRHVADLAAVIGTRASFEMLRAVTAMPNDELVAAVDELRGHRVLVEAAEGDTIVYDFHHPILQQTLYADLGLARARVLHGTVADALETFYGEHAESHADELAFHFSRADARAQAPKAARYLAAAGREALAKYANREAANYLSAALQILDRGGAGMGDDTVSRLLENLAQAQQRLGEYESAYAHWERAREAVSRAGEMARLASVERRMGLSCYWSGSYEEALRHYAAGIAAARDADDPALQARIRLARGMCLQELGRPADAMAEVREALAVAERIGDEALLARVHRALLLLHVWTGSAELAREAGERAIELADRSGQLSVACTAHWALAMLGGLTGRAVDVVFHLAESERLADAVRSPLLRVWTAEIAIEYASGIGDWDAGIALAERTIALARTLGQRLLLPRLLVWAALLYFGRGDLARGKAYVDEAWRLSGAERERGADRPLDVHMVVPAHIGLAAQHLACGEYERAVEVGEAGLAIADRSGYVVWAVHRLLPIMAEAALWAKDLERARRLGERLRRDSTRLGHLLGMAWADACDALVAMLEGEQASAVEPLRAAVEQLEAIPFIADAARLRFQLARVLGGVGDRDAALRELRRTHEVFSRLGAELELDRTRTLLRELGGRPPARVAAGGPEGLTGRELEIIRLVAARKSNKEIGTALGISPRTVSTHLSNIFGKVSVASRGELVDFARQNQL